MRKKFLYSLVGLHLILFVSIAVAQECIDKTAVPGVWDMYEVENYTPENEKELLDVMQALETGEKTLADLPQENFIKEGIMKFLDSGAVSVNLDIPHTSEPIIVQVTFLGTWELDCNTFTTRLAVPNDIEIVIDETAVPKEQMEELKKQVEMMKPEVKAGFMEGLQTDPHFTEEGSISEVLFGGEKVALIYSSQEGNIGYNFFVKTK